MVARTVTGTILRPDGTAPTASLVIDLVVADIDGVGWIVTTGNGIASRITVTPSATTGAFSVDLEPNSNIVPANSRWRFRYTTTGGRRWEATFYVEVPDSPGPHPVDDLVVAEPGTFVAATRAVIPFDFVGGLSVGAGVRRWLMPFPATVLGVTAAVNTAPVGSAIVVDVNRNGTSLFTVQANRPQIAAGANATVGSAAPAVVSLATGDYLTVDVDQVGSGVAGADLTVLVRIAHN
jgi:hypothetical protein